MAGRTSEVGRAELVDLCTAALLGAGASADQAEVLAEATVQAELRGRHAVGLSHLFDHVEAFREGRIDGTTVPSISRATDVVGTVDCANGLAQHGFRLALAGLRESAKEHGIGVVSLRRCFTAGELGYYVRALNDHGLLGLACANAPALMSVGGAPGPVLGTNPMAYGVPLPDGRRVVIDQACSSTAWVTVRDAARHGESIPEGWAVDTDGMPTTSAAAGLAGALLPFGGYRGGNLALLVEVLATLSGGLFSVDAPAFDHGDRSPAVGLLVVAVSLSTLDPSYSARLAAQLARWRTEYGVDTDVWLERPEAGSAQVRQDTLDQLHRLAGHALLEEGRG